MMWQPIETAPHDVDVRILIKDADGWVRIGWWTNDVYTYQGGRGGPAGWFAGEYDDNWGDRPRMCHPVKWMPIPGDEP